MRERCLGIINRRGFAEPGYAELGSNDDEKRVALMNRLIYLSFRNVLTEMFPFKTRKQKDRPFVPFSFP